MFGRKVCFSKIANTDSGLEHYFCKLTKINNRLEDCLCKFAKTNGQLEDYLHKFVTTNNPTGRQHVKTMLKTAAKTTNAKTALFRRRTCATLSPPQQYFRWVTTRVPVVLADNCPLADSNALKPTRVQDGNVPVRCQTQPCGMLLLWLSRLI